MMLSRTGALGTVKVAVSPLGRFYRFFVADVASWCLWGCTNAPVSDYAGCIVRG